MGKDALASEVPDDRRRWRALTVLCLGVVMIMVDTTIVNVALPSIRQDLGVTESSLAWVVNAYMLTFGGFLLLGGRLGDVFGHRRLFLTGITLFTISSFACGIASTTGVLIAARAVQGLGGAIVAAATLSLIMCMFTTPADRAKAMAIYGFISYSGGSIGLLLGGTLTTALSWHWIFLVNVPVGVAVYGLCASLLPHDKLSGAREIDAWGAITVTSSLLLATFAVSNVAVIGWTPSRKIALAASIVALLIFCIIERRAPRPLIPAGILRHHLTILVIVAVLWATGVRTWSFISPLYMQLVLEAAPMQIAAAFLASTVISSAFALGLSAKLVTRLGTRPPLGAGMLLGAIGLALLVRAPIDGDVLTDVLPSMVLLGLGIGLVFSPLVIAAMEGVPSSESGLVSGLINTASLMGGALGLAVVASLSTARTNELLTLGATSPAALTGGYHAAFLAAALCAGVAALLGLAGTRMNAPVHTPQSTRPVRTEQSGNRSPVPESVAQDSCSQSIPSRARHFRKLESSRACHGRSSGRDSKSASDR